MNINTSVRIVPLRVFINCVLSTYLLSLLFLSLPQTNISPPDPPTSGTDQQDTTPLEPQAPTTNHEETEERTAARLPTPPPPVAEGEELEDSGESYNDTTPLNP